MNRHMTIRKQNEYVLLRITIIKGKKIMHFGKNKPIVNRQNVIDEDYNETQFDSLYNQE